MAKEKVQGTEVVNPQPSQELEVPKARVLAEVFAPNGKIRVELLPEGAGGSAEGGSVDLQPLADRVAALEAKPEAEHVDLSPLTARVEALERKPNGGGASNAFPMGNYDRNKYNRTVTEEEVEKMLRDGTAPEHQGDSEMAADNLQNLPDYMRAACCVYECPTAEKVVLKEGVEFVRLRDKKTIGDNSYPVELFYNTTTSEVFVFSSDARDEEGRYIKVYPYNALTKGMYFPSESPFVTSVSKINYRKQYNLGKAHLSDILQATEPIEMLLKIAGLNKAKVGVGGLTAYTSEERRRELSDTFMVEVDNHEEYIPLTDKKKTELFKDEDCVVFKNVVDGTLYKMGLTSKQYDASEVQFAFQDAKYFKGEVLGQIPGIPGTYTIREDFYVDMGDTLGIVAPATPTNPKPLEPVADQIKKLLGLS